MARVQHVPMPCPLCAHWAVHQIEADPEVLINCTHCDQTNPRVIRRSDLPSFLREARESYMRAAELHPRLSGLREPGDSLALQELDAE